MARPSSFEQSSLGTKWLKAAPISDKDRELICASNPKKLLKM